MENQEVQNLWTVLENGMPIIGVVVGFILSQTSQHWGCLFASFQKLTIFPKFVYHGEQAVTSFSNAEYAEIEVSVDLQNNKSYPLACRDIKLLMINEKTYHNIGLYENRAPTEGSLVLYGNKIHVLNLQAKSVEYHKFHCYIDGEELSTMKKNADNINYYLYMKTHRNRVSKFRIPKDMIEVIKPKDIQE
jgi:hypothetical protein